MQMGICVVTLVYMSVEWRSDQEEILAERPILLHFLLIPLPLLYIENATYMYVTSRIKQLQKQILYSP